MITIYNTKSRQVETFRPIKSGQVRMYTCGPTVYNYPHIGNYRAYITADLIKRMFLYNGLNVLHIMNLTDVDDKTIRDSQKANKDLLEFTEFYTKEFLKDIESLNIVTPTKFTKATDHISEMAEMVGKLIDKGYAYKTGDGSVYFDITSFTQYGALSHLQKESLKANASGHNSADEYEKEDIRDFALWKAYTPEDGGVFWETNLGKGRPGWHIECSAMSTKYLGNHFDVHTGGVDLIFPHHENEIAQSECSTGEAFVNYWLHNDHLLVDGKKMSKSAGNFYTLHDVVEKEFTSLALRYFILQGHYRSQINFTWEALVASQNAYKKLLGITKELKKSWFSILFGKINQKYKLQFLEKVNDDINTPEALAVVWEMIKDDKLSKGSKYKTLLDFDEVLGLGFSKIKKEEVSFQIKNLVNDRALARKQKDWARADELRAQIEALGYSVRDTSKGQEVEKI